MFAEGEIDGNMEMFAEGGYMGKAGGGKSSVFLEIRIKNFNSSLLFDLLFTCRLKDPALVIFHLCL